MFRALLVSAIAIVSAILLLDTPSQGGGQKMPVNIKNVMRAAMKGGNANLCTKVVSGKASEAEKKLLVALFTDLAANACPKGDAENWKKRTTALLEGAKEAAKSGDTKALKKAVNCQACHDEHRG